MTALNQSEFNEFKARRAQFIRQMEANSIAIVWAAPDRVRSGDSEYPYRQNSDFYYLTGFVESHAAAVFIPGRAEGEFLLFNQTNNIDLEIWIGKRVGQEDACEYYGADQAYPIEELDEIMPKLMENKKKLYFSVGSCPHLDRKVTGWLNQIRRRVRSGSGAPEQINNVNQLLHEMRLIKSDFEIDLMRQSAELSAQAHIKAMEACRDAKYEYQVEAVMWNHLAMQGVRSWAYTPIVGAGANACVLHYIDNTAPLKSGDLLLVDAGGEYKYYAADITRTYPINGKFSPEQKSIYELVLKSQEVGINTAKAGTPWNKIQQNIIQVLTEGLVDLGILKGSVNSLIEQEAYKQFYMHNSGHWLGVDVHDVGNYKVEGEWRNLEAGMVLTVEPGIYIKESNDVDPRWWNIGVRIEDDIVVTSGEAEVMSVRAPKKVDEIEAIIRG